MAAPARALRPARASRPHPEAHNQARLPLRPAGGTACDPSCHQTSSRASLTRSPISHSEATFPAGNCENAKVRESAKTDEHGRAESGGTFHLFGPFLAFAEFRVFAVPCRNAVLRFHGSFTVSAWSALTFRSVCALPS